MRLANHELEAAAVATMDDDALMADEQRSERTRAIPARKPARGIGMTVEESAHWTPSNTYTCPRCDGLQCIYIQTFKGLHQYDDNMQEPAITIRCITCKHLWKEPQPRVIVRLITNLINLWHSGMRVRGERRLHSYCHCHSLSLMKICIAVVP